MSYLTGTSSTFPATLDSFTEKYDLSGSLLTSATRWNILRFQTSRTTAEELEYNTLTTTLANYIFSATDLNYLMDSMYNLENFTKTTLESYFAYKGTYSATTTYSIFNTVSYNGNTYLALQSTYGNLPTNTTYWLQNSVKGDKGDQGDPGVDLANRGTYNNSTTYTLNDLVIYSGSTYYCIATSTGNVPTNTNYWSLFLSPSSLPVTSVQEVLLSTTSSTTVASHTLTTAKNILFNVYFRVITASTTVTITVNYTNTSGVQTTDILPAQSCAVGSYELLPLFVNCVASTLTITATAGTANQVYVSASILEVS